MGEPGGKASKANWSSLSRGGMVAAVALAGACFVLAFTEANFRAAIWAGLGCACTVVARMFQAEAHRGGE